MRLAIIKTYPIYHSSPSLTVDQWLKRTDRERILAALMSDLGHQVELWAVNDINGPSTSVTTAINLKGFKIRIFQAVKKGKKTKYHFSVSLTDFAKEFNADLYILKGVDGGIGSHLLHHFLVPNQRSYAFIIGGEYYSAYVPGARIIFYETEAQKNKLISPGRFNFRKEIPSSKLIRLPKYIDTRLFSPISNEYKKWDLLVVGRLISGYKNYDALKYLSQHFRVAVIGDGPQGDRLKSQYPAVDWLGYVPNLELPRFYNQSHLFMHTGFRDYYPRVIAEALSCGTPCVAFSPGITADVLPHTCGLLVSQKKFIDPIRELLVDKKRLNEMSLNARKYALTNIGEEPCKKALQEMFYQLNNNESLGI